jgi:hypothetical protein
MQFQRPGLWFDRGNAASPSHDDPLVRAWITIGANFFLVSAQSSLDAMASRD